MQTHRLNPIARLALTLALLALPRAAAANLAAPQSSPSATSPPGALRVTPLEIQGESLTIDCDEVDGEPRCTFEARYTVHNPTSLPEQMDAAFYGVRADQVAIQVDGRSVTRELTEAEALAFDAWLPQPQESLEDRPPTAPVELHWNEHVYQEIGRTGARFALEAGATTTLTATGEMRPGRNFKPSYAIPAVEARHLLLNTFRPDTSYNLDYLLGPIKTWAAVGDVAIRVTWPERWSFSGEFYALTRTNGPGRLIGALDEAPRAWNQAEEPGDRRSASIVIPGDQLSDVLTMRFGVPGTTLSLGGPLVGIGGTTGDQGGFRMRFGYEVAAPEWLLYSVSADTDFGDLLKAAPTIEVASSQVLILPSFGIGVGAPVLILPEVQVGARVQGTMQFGPVGFVTSLDAFPGLSGDREVGRWQLTLLGQIAL